MVHHPLQKKEVEASPELVEELSQLEVEERALLFPLQ
jgi:hypothetical protein